MAKKRKQRAEPLEAWMRREDVSPTVLLRAERGGVPLPFKVRPKDGAVIVLTDHTPPWFMAASILGFLPAGHRRAA